MKNYRNLLFYVFTILIAGIGIYYIVNLGGSLESSDVKAIANEDFSKLSAFEQFLATLKGNIGYPLAILLFQIVTIITVARIFGAIFQKIGQPSVIGEIIAGIFLGPSFIGYYFPEFSTFLFPVESLENLNVLSQFGLVLFMFVVGMELDLKVLKNKAQEAVVISHSSIIFPFFLGVILSYFIYREFAAESADFLSFALFMGISMSITAFPVLARIVQERNMTKTRLGSIVITCAAADDITAWCLLAAVIAIVKAGSFISSLYTIVLAIGYVLLMIKIVRPFLHRIGDLYSNKEGLSKPIVAIFFVTLLLSAWSTEVIGIHALFGAFMAGVIMPPNMNFRSVFIEKVEDVALVLLLPLFFVYTGLRTEIGLLNNVDLWLVCLLIIGVATAGKFIGSAFAAKFVGQSWADSFRIGALMNTRGLMELVVLNIGYDLGILGPEIFAMMVIMALATTFMTGPILEAINYFTGVTREDEILEDAGEKGKYNILISFANPNTGKVLIRLANTLIKKSKSNSTLTAMHLSQGDELNTYTAIEFEKSSFVPLQEEAQRIDQPLVTLFKPTQDIDKEIVETANLGNYDLLLIGIGQSVFDGTFLGKILGFTTRIMSPERLFESIKRKDDLELSTHFFDERTKHILRNTNIPVGILIDKGLENIQQVSAIITNKADLFLLEYMQKMIHNSGVVFHVVDINGVAERFSPLKEAVRNLELVAPDHFHYTSVPTIQDSYSIPTGQLLLVSLSGWRFGIKDESQWLGTNSSVLILKDEA